MCEVSEYDTEKVLPTMGILYFFYDAEQNTVGFDPAERRNWRVLHLDGYIDSLRRMPFPASLQERGMYTSCALKFNNEITLPPWESRYIDKLKLSSEERDLYFEPMEELNLFDVSEEKNRLLGHPDIIQGEMQLDCQLVSNGVYIGYKDRVYIDGSKDPRREQLEAGVEDWSLLLQIDSIKDAGIMWGDSGRIYYWIRKQDLKKLNFEDVWMFWQCY